MNATIAIYLISIVATAGVIIRPFKVPEFVWALAGAALLLILGLISFSTAWTGILKGTDVYLFLTGMMLLSESARQEGLFDWLACHATRFAGGSPVKLFLLIYLVGVVVTTFMSNDATAVVLTPAVAAAVQSAKVKQPLPYLFICAFIANAASFVLPISNPANLVIYGAHMPSLLLWLKSYLLPSVFSIVITLVMLYLTQRKDLREPIEKDVETPTLSHGGKIALAGILLTIVTLIFASAKDWQLGLPTAIAGIFTAIIVVITAKRNPLKVIGNISWAVLPLVAGLFILVEALGKVGLVETISNFIKAHAESNADATAFLGGTAIAFACNLVNNLPAGLIAGSAVTATHIPDIVKSGILIGVDLGPNLSVTGSLATILWLTELRRNGQSVGAWQFLKLGALVMIPALCAALLALWI
ncbi:arsenic transporter [Mucilaginibacter sp. KACC 22063]|uniref:arsenic transporter n=1 Tax=Mucilaginibacter sp. KACC 22063 TaxID=3025666 RepID=UPI002366CCE0|nr:arsenic transporter [Mucilaginibacter sp. KACC 22063]WDF56130.1 arsenic transporter [Mucilaginibacter sp. KACC 22063]